MSTNGRLVDEESEAKYAKVQNAYVFNVFPITAIWQLNYIFILIPFFIIFSMFGMFLITTILI